MHACIFNAENGGNLSERRKKKRRKYKCETETGSTINCTFVSFVFPLWGLHVAWLFLCRSLFAVVVHNFFFELRKLRCASWWKYSNRIRIVLRSYFVMECFFALNSRLRLPVTMSDKSMIFRSWFIYVLWLGDLIFTLFFLMVASNNETT